TRQIAHPGSDEEMLFARTGTILVAGRGTLGEGEIFGHALYITGRYAKGAYTGDLLRLVPKKGHEAVTYAFLTTPVGIRLLTSTAVGTKILFMRSDLLRDLPIATLSADQRIAVQKHVEQAMLAR